MSWKRHYQVLRLRSAVMRANIHAGMCGLLSRSVAEYVAGEQPSNRSPGLTSRIGRLGRISKMRLIWLLAYASRPVMWVWMKIL